MTRHASPARFVNNMNDTSSILCLSHLGGRFRAMALNRGIVQGKWERPEPLENFENFEVVVKEAVKRTGFRGSQASLVLGHPRLTHQLLDTPPAKGWTLDRFIKRRAEQLKPFEAEAVLSYQATSQPKRGNALVLHLFPKPFLDQLFEGCAEAGLHLHKVFPLPAVLKGQLGELPLEKEEVALIAAESEGTTTFIIGRKDGEVFLGRSLTSNWHGNPDRVNVDLHRTILFVEQQFGVAVSSIWLFGPGAAEHVSVMQPMVKVPVKISPVAYNSYYWIEQGLKLAAEDTNNLIGPELRKAPQRRLFLRATATLVACLMVVSILGSAFIEVLVRTQRNALEELKPQAAELQAERGEWREQYETLGKQQEWIRLVTERQAPPVPNWFLSYLGEVFPEELVLTQLDVKRVEELWSVQLRGTLQPLTNAAPGALAKSVSALTNSLASGPFNLKILAAHQAPQENAAAGQSGNRPPPPEGTDFIIQGTMQ
jgi:hypothetical protein